MSKEAGTLHYFGVKAKAHYPLLVAAYAGLDVTWDKNFNWGELKSKTPFGQVPYYESSSNSGVKLAQSAAIGRYFARVGKLEGDNDKDFGVSEMLIEESNDIYQLLMKANRAEKKADEYNKIFDDELPKHLTNLEKLAKDNKFTSKVTSGEIALFATLDTFYDIEPKFLDNHAQLKAFYNNLRNDSHFKAYFANPPNQYFKRN